MYILLGVEVVQTDHTERGCLSVARFCYSFLSELRGPACSVGTYSIGHLAGGTSQNMICKTLRQIDSPTLYVQGLLYINKTINYLCKTPFLRPRRFLLATRAGSGTPSCSAPLAPTLPSSRRRGWAGCAARRAPTSRTASPSAWCSRSAPQRTSSTWRTRGQIQQKKFLLELWLEIEFCPFLVFFSSPNSSLFYFRSLYSSKKRFY